MPPRLPVDRIWDHYVAEDRGYETDCWIWQMSVRPDGYGQVSAAGRMQLAHRVAWQLAHGLIESNLELDHLCRQRDCINPEHLELIPHALNCQRGDAGAHQLAKTHCPHGHPYRAPNLYYDSAGRRRCRECRRISRRVHPSAGSAVSERGGYDQSAA